MRGLGRLESRVGVVNARVSGNRILHDPPGDLSGPKREAVNNWIRKGDFDAVIDFDAVVRGPDHPTRLRAEYDVGDHLHPNDAGHGAMGDAVDLKLFE